MYAVHRTLGDTLALQYQRYGHLRNKEIDRHGLRTVRGIMSHWRWGESQTRANVRFKITLGWNYVQAEDKVRQTGDKLSRKRKKAQIGQTGQ
jgi:hypothetical protein